MIHVRHCLFCYRPSTKIDRLLSMRYYGKTCYSMIQPCILYSLLTNPDLSHANSSIHKNNFALKICSLALQTIVSFFSEFTISFASLFPLPSCFLNPINLLRFENVIVTEAGCLKTLSQSCQTKNLLLQVWESRSKSSTDVLCSLLD